MGKDKWENLGMGIAGQLAGTGMGLLLEGHNDQRQLEQERKLQEIQMMNNKKMVDYNMAAQMKMWNDTNYGAQVEHMKKAGLNPGLLYGMGGGGGMTTGSPGGSGPQSGGAPKGGGEAMGMGLAGAQMQLIAAQTEKTQAEAAKIKGVDTEESKSRMAEIAARIPNHEASTKVLGLEADIMGIEKEIANRTKEDAIDIITAEAGAAEYEVKRLQRKNQIEAATVDEVIGTIKQEYIGVALRNILTSASTANVRQDTKLKTAQTATEGERRYLTIQQWKAIANSVTIGWDNLSTENRKIRLQETLGQYGMNEGAMLDLAEQAVDGVMRGSGGGPKDKRTWETRENEDGTRSSTERYEKYGR